ncbi:MAG: RNA polymerase sigma factor region1.1 domain-containing protein [Treponema sp.]|nr:RNA polymerase sigma factor region1.1 domain-containing protein [Treponema sp.]
MISKFQYNQFIEAAKIKGKITWTDIENFFGEDFLDTEEFDDLLYKLDDEGIKVKNDSITKVSDDTLIFESYIDFEDSKKITRREELGGKKDLNPNKVFKDYLINAHFIMNYDLKTISKLYGISIEILEDWIFTYENNYETIVPHCYYSTTLNTDFLYIRSLMNFNSYRNYDNTDTNTFFIDCCYEVPENIRKSFNDLYKSKEIINEEKLAISLKIYPSLVKELKKDLKITNKKDYFYKMALKKIPMWAQNPSQYNHKLIRAYFKAYHRFDEPPTKNMIKEICDTDKTCYVENFQATYSSLKADGPNTNGKVFIDDGNYVQIWEEIEDILLRFEKYFYNEE